MSTSDQLVNAANVVNDALATMNQAKLVIEQLRREKAAMLEALKQIVEEIGGDCGIVGCDDPGCSVSRLAEAAICLAKGE